MNQFSKQELEHILYLMGREPMDDCSLYLKIKAMIDNHRIHNRDEIEDKLNHGLADLAERINLVADGVLNIYKRVNAIEKFIVK